MSCNTIATVSQAQAERERTQTSSHEIPPLPELDISSNAERWLCSFIQVQPSFSLFPSPPRHTPPPPFQSNIANVIFHESCSIYQGQWHIEGADECLTPLDLYNERWESETHSEVVSTCTKEVEMIYSASESQSFREL